MLSPLRFFPAALITLIVSLISATPSLAADTTPVDKQEIAPDVVELPTFTVTDSRILPPPESWRYAEIPGFEILSNASTRETKRFVSDFQLLQQVVDVIWPAARMVTPAVPTALVLCKRGDSFSAFLSPEQNREWQRMNSLFLQGGESAAIVIDFALDEVDIGAGIMEENDPYRAFYLQYFRFLIRRMIATPPPWLEEGLVQLFASVDFDKKSVDFGKIGDGFGNYRSGDFHQRLQRRALVSMDVLFAPERPRRDRAPLWDAQAYAFVHLCLYGNGKRYQKPFIKFIDRLSREPVSEELFKECFGMSYNRMAIEIRGYTEFTAHQYVRYQATKGKKVFEDPPPIELREATEAEVGRIKGEALRLAGNTDDARSALIAPYIRGSRDPRLLASLGLFELSAGQDDRARKFLEAAAKANAVRARAYLELARLRYRDALAQPGGTAGKLSPEQSAAVLQPLHIAHRQPPPQLAVYELMLEVWQNSITTPPARESFTTLLEGLDRFPGSLKLVYQTAEFGSQNGFPEQAARLADYGLKVSRTDEAKSRFAQLKASLPPPVKKPAEKH